MRRRGQVFKSFRNIPLDKNISTIEALSIINENFKLILEMLADLRVNTSNDPKLKEDEKEH